MELWGADHIIRMHLFDQITSDPKFLLSWLQDRDGDEISGIFGKNRKQSKTLQDLNPFYRYFVEHICIC